MENTERQKFEENWKQAFEGAEMPPSDSVWANLDIRLDNEKMKRRVVYYQRLAAASILFALLLGVWGVRYLGNNSSTELAVKKQSTTNENPSRKENPSASLPSIANSSLNAEKVIPPKNNDLENDNILAKELKDNNKTDNNSLASGIKTEKNVYQKEVIIEDNKDNKLIASSQIHSTIKAGQQVAKKNSKDVNNTGRGKSNKEIQKQESTSQEFTIRNKNSIAGTEGTGSTPVSVEKKERNNKLIASSQIHSTIKTDQQVAEKNSKNVNNTGSERSNKEIQKQESTSQEFTTRNNNSIASKETESAPVSIDKMARENSIISEDNIYKRFTAFLSPELEQKELPNAKLLPAKKRELPAMPAIFMASSNKKKKNEDVWLSVGAAAGSYNPGATTGRLYTASSSQSALSNNVSPQNDRSSSGSAYSFGFAVGKKIADHWVLHTGLNYLNQTVGYTSNFVTYSSSNQNKAYTADYVSSQNSAPLSITQPYKVNSTLEFVSIPMQTGYLIVDRKIGVQLNAGLATDIFLRNTLKDQSGQSDKYSQARGSDSPYRAVNLAWLAGTELSYKVGRQYRLALVPGVRYSFNPSQKEPSSSASNPFVLDVGFRFRYIFE